MNSTYSYIRMHDATIKITNLSCNERNFLRFSFASCCFSLAVTFYRSRRICLCMETKRGAVSFCRPHFRDTHLPYLITCSFRSTHSMSFQILQLSLDCEFLFLMTYFSAFSDLVDLKYWGWLHFRFHCSLTLFPVCFYRFSSTLLASRVI